MPELRQRHTHQTEQQENGTTEHTAGPQASEKPPQVSRMHEIFGFDWSDLSSWNQFVKLLHRPTDPSGLAAFRIGYGLLMTIDILEERGLSYADYRWGDPNECRFPLLHFMGVLPIKWMYMVYLVMLTGSLGIMFGFCYRLSCVLFAVPYWYVFLLDKMSWNNHSYLYGLTALMLTSTNANRYWSIDGLIWPKLRNSHIPLWNHGLLRAQYFIVYFLAGVKKIDADWIGGYSMDHLAGHWVFSPFTMFFSKELVDLVVVHWTGFMLDLSVGYLLFFDKTRPIGLFFSTSFNCMNSQLFSIGMFPYTMMAASTLFCYCDWMRNLVKKLPSLHWILPLTAEPQTNDMCIYDSKQAQDKDETDSKKPPNKKTVSGAHWRQHFAAIGFVAYLSLQAFLPFSHGVTKGYNNWTNGLYGYSWDMMVHSWSTQHVRITFKNKDTGEVGYLNPQAWSRDRNRWSSHADMMVQYAACIKEHMVRHGHENIELYFDVWRSLNDRFQQRMFDPRVDILTADWHPFKETPWVMPLLTDLSDWRSKIADIEQNVYDNFNDTDVVFIADFPGLMLENYLQPELNDTILQLLKGEVAVEILGRKGNITVKEGETIKLPGGEFHNVYTISEGPSCFMYTFVNKTEMELRKNITIYEKIKAAEAEGPADHITEQLDLTPESRFVMDKYLIEKERLQGSNNNTLWDTFTDFATAKWHKYERSFFMTKMALQSVFTRRDMADVFNEAAALSDTPLDGVFTTIAV